MSHGILEHGMIKDSESTRGTFFEQERRALEARLQELRPALAEAERIRRRLATIEALQAEAVSGPASMRKGRGRKRFSTEARALQALEVISQRPEELRRKDVAEILGVQISRAGKIVNWLVERGLVKDRDGGTLAATEKAERRLREPSQSEAHSAEGPGFSIKVEGPVEGGSE